MCGIVGYVSKKQNAVQVLIEGLKSLEYRGYDSAGIAFNNNGKMKIVKVKGKVNVLNEKVKNLKGNVGIGHTRWATHGAPNEINAHPHKVGNVTIVHNGIIENYKEIKKELEKEGIKFKSETDTEVVAGLISFIYKNNENKLETLKEVSLKIKGSFALGIIFDDENETIYALRKDSPLIIALGENENYIASDVPAILSFTNKFILLEKDEIAKITYKKINIYNKKLSEITKPVLTYEGTKESVMKNGFDHFMLKEIYDEPKVIENILQSYCFDYNIKTLENKFGSFLKYNKINIVACGSAMHAGLVGKSIIENEANVPVEVFLASEYRYNKVFNDKKTLTILISQSGETADTLAALRKAKKDGSDTLGIINVVGSSIARESGRVIYIKAGSEIAVATTKAYQAQVFILMLLSILISYQKGNITLEKANKLLKEFKKFPKEIEAIINDRDNYLKIAERIYKQEDIFFIGRKVDYFLCQEGSLKLKEISYIHSEAYAAGELKHGTISLVKENTPVIGVITDKLIDEKTVSNIKETVARGADVLIVTTDELYDKYKTDKFYSNIVIIPKTNVYKRPILAIIPLQLIAYEVAKLRGESIDQPRNLAKSVTVE
ncbi:MAG: glutamine--fructose-6-phosphate transaminase (isomerizing) [Bacilli bacterium]|nr:glutamine--fructose-6-phosphate transaminase (isomerizing) [Bacilli bacterium]